MNTLNAAIQPMVQAMFWGVVLTALAMPVATAIGGAVVGKILPKKKNE